MGPSVSVITLLLGIGAAQDTAGSPSCPCLTELPAALKASDAYDPENGCLYPSIGSVTYCYPLDYGIETCDAHDDSLLPYCTELFEPDFCARQWCYVDQSECSGSEIHASSYFNVEDIYYSYDTCGSVNTFVSWFEDTLPRSMMELVSVIEKYARSIKSELEVNLEQILEAIEGGAECQLENACMGCGLECVYNECWGQERDTLATNTVLSNFLESIINEEDEETLACIARFISQAYERIAAVEYNDEDRVAYQYFGSQNTGALINWPAVEFCSDAYDARLRPWYASAASGPKNLVLVIDTSGSMGSTVTDGSTVTTRIEIAREAAIAVLGTLTWVDRVSIVLFNVAVKAIYSETLVEATQDNLDLMRAWIRVEVVSSGGTNFEDPLRAAYNLLETAGPACSKVILFMTDGEALLTDALLDSLVYEEPEAIVFTYKIGDMGDVEPLQRLSCATNGLFYPVENVQNLPDAMAGYYNYFVMLQDQCKIAWVRYTDAITGVELVSACTPVFNTVSTRTELLGVNCVDLNLVVSPAELRTCGRDGDRYNAFVGVIRDLGTECGSASHITDSCVLGQLRESISPDSICPTDQTGCPRVTNIAYGSNRSCSVTEVQTFIDIPLDGCDRNFTSCEGNIGNGGGDAAEEDEGGDDGNGGGRKIFGSYVAVIVAACAVSVCSGMALAVLCLGRRARSKLVINAPHTDQSGRSGQSQILGVVPGAPSHAPIEAVTVVAVE